MNKFYVIGIGYRPLDDKASYIIKRSDVVLATERLVEVFKRYDEFNDVKKKLKVTVNIFETMEYIRNNYEKENISVLADGDPMFFGFGRQVLKEFDKDAVEILPDLSSIQVAFARINEPWGNVFMMSLHGGPDPKKRRKPEYEIEEIQKLLEIYDKVGILTDNVNNPASISKALLKVSDLKMYVCEKLGYPEENITEGTPGEIAKGSFLYPNVVIVIKTRG
jgi:precorrin-6Y C5,15-methyltransferase (decarboxylating)